MLYKNIVLGPFIAVLIAGAGPGYGQSSDVVQGLVTGIVGQALNQAKTPQAASTGASQQTEAMQIQAALNRTGYDAGPVDGIPGKRTRAAILNWQVANGFAGTGQLTPVQKSLLLNGGAAGVTATAAALAIMQSGGNSTAQSAANAASVLSLGAGQVPLATPPGSAGVPLPVGQMPNFDLSSQSAASVAAAASALQGANLPPGAIKPGSIPPGLLESLPGGFSLPNPNALQNGVATTTGLPVFEFGGGNSAANAEANLLPAPESADPNQAVSNAIEQATVLQGNQPALETGEQAGTVATASAASQQSVTESEAAGKAASLPAIKGGATETTEGPAPEAGTTENTTVVTRTRQRQTTYGETTASATGTGIGTVERQGNTSTAESREEARRQAREEAIANYTPPTSTTTTQVQPSETNAFYVDPEAAAAKAEREGRAASTEYAIQSAEQLVRTLGNEAGFEETEEIVQEVGQRVREKADSDAAIREAAAAISAEPAPSEPTIICTLEMRRQGQCQPTK
ncbi:peptidoglycan-binding protein [Marimonas sp. MJW-29]|uniref:Peptidoglycan-binding protein n=1 Tax=Sulfitobacter sediminis TaxID=3234186 RepID=A0ABV3RVL8_9RHOB